MRRFEDWLNEVDEAVYRIAGVSRRDLADYPYRDAYDAGEAPEDVARALLEEEGFPVGDDRYDGPDLDEHLTASEDSPSLEHYAPLEYLTEG
jgi:hypothetical protein